jgi:hypothetical protein
MILRAMAVVALALLLVACTQQSAPVKTSRGDPFAQAQDQAFALGQVLGDVEACDGEAWMPPFEEFMAAKSKRGLDGHQTATIAALVGSAQYRSDPALVDCSAESRAKRAAALDQMRSDW